MTHNVFVLWLVALAGTKLAKRTEPLGKSDRIFRVSYNKQLVIHVVTKSTFRVVLINSEL